MSILSLGRSRNGRLVFATVAMAALGTLGLAPGAVSAAGGDVKELASGADHTCAIRTDRSVWCWGDNEYYQLADGTVQNRPKPVRVELDGGGFLDKLSRFDASAAHHACGRKPDLAVRCWGDNGSGQLGDGSEDARQFPVKPVKVGGAPLDDVAAVATGYAHTCALTTAHTVWCWGYNSYGQMGVGDHFSHDGFAMQVTRAGGENLTGIVAITAGWTHSCALKGNGTVWCWGNNSAGEVGDGSFDDEVHRAVKVKTNGGGTLRRVRDVDAGGEHTCALMRDRTVRCWGLNDHDQLGAGTGLAAEVHLPVKVKLGKGSLRNVVDLSAGWSQTCVVRSDSSAWCWGLNDYGQVGDGSEHDRPKPVRVRKAGGGVFPATVRSVHGGGEHTCLLKKDGSAWCWGRSEFGELGNGKTNPETHTPRKVDFP